MATTRHTKKGTTVVSRHVHAARNGTLIIGGGFGGAHVARLLGRAGATIVNPDASMLYTPMLPEVAAGVIEPRHVIVPLRQMCRHAEILRGRVVSLDETARQVTVATEHGRVAVSYERLVVALGSTARMLPIPGLTEKAITFKALGDAIHLRNHVLRRLELADADPAHAERHLTFVFVGGGYAGVEAIAEVRQLVADSWRHYPRLQDLSPRWVLVDAAPKVLAEVPGGLGEAATRQLRRDGVDVRVSTRLIAVERDAVTLSDGTRLETDTLVWTAGVEPPPIVSALGLPLDERGRIVVGSSLRVEGRADIWALGDCAAVPNTATPGRMDPPTCQHALRQARRLVKALNGDQTPYRYRSLGQGATLGRLKGIARVGGMDVRGVLASMIVRWYHVSQVPQLSRAFRVMADSLLSLVFGRDFAEVPVAEPKRAAA
jgi:NADH:ubiquinone reductase (H+-translocating)